MATNHFEIPGVNVRFVTGLQWQLLRNSSEGRAEARKLAEEMRFDLMVWNTPDDAAADLCLVGFASSREGYKRGSCSVAALVSASIKKTDRARDFICAVALPGGRFLYVSQINGAIPEGRDFIGSQEQVRTLLMEDIALDRMWDIVIAPTMWGIDHSFDRSFMEFLPKTKGRVDVKALYKFCLSNVRLDSRRLLVYGLLATLVLGSGLGVMTYLNNQKERARLAAMLLQSKSAEKRPPVPPWINKVKAVEGWSACSAVLQKNQQVMFQGNWTPDSISCDLDGRNLLFLWSGDSQRSWISHLKATEPNAVISSEGGSLSASFAQPVATVVAGQAEPLVDRSSRLLAMQQVAQEYGLVLQISNPPAPAVLPGADKADAQALPTWGEVRWSIENSALAPEVILPLLDGVGFRLGRVTARFKDGLINWNLEGVQYVLP